MRLRSFLRARRTARTQEDWSEFMSHLSPALRSDVALELNAERLTNVPFFAGSPKQFLVRLAFTLRPELYPPLETVIFASESADRLYIIRNGLVAVNGAVRGRGGVIGEDMVFRQAGTRGYKVRTCSHTY